MTQQEAIIKIQKVLVLAERGDKHEAENAMARVYELLKTYQLTLAEIRKGAKEAVAENSSTKKSPEPAKERKTPNNDSQDFVNPFIESAGVTPHGMHLLYQLIGDTLGKYFFVVCPIRHMTSGKTQQLIIGRPHNVEIAKYVFAFLVKKFQELWIQYRNSRALDSDAYYSYMCGLNDGMLVKLEKERMKLSEKDRKTLSGLEDALSKYMEQITGGRTSSRSAHDQYKHHDWNVRTDAQAHGEAIDIIHGVKKQDRVSAPPIATAPSSVARKKIA